MNDYIFRLSPRIIKPAPNSQPRIIKGMGSMRYERGPHKGAIHLPKGSRKAKAYMQFVRSFKRRK